MWELGRLPQEGSGWEETAGKYRECVLSREGGQYLAVMWESGPGDARSSGFSEEAGNPNLLWNLLIFKCQ